MRTFKQFTAEVEKLVKGTAVGKGYSRIGPDEPNELYEFVQNLSGGHQHAIGEVVYKMKRFAAKENEEDILKAAAWCWLIWKHNQ